MAVNFAFREKNVVVQLQLYFLIMILYIPFTTFYLSFANFLLHNCYL